MYSPIIKKIFSVVMFFCFVGSLGQAESSVRLKDKKLDLLVSDFFAKTGSEKQFQQKNKLLKQLQKDLSKRVDELIDLESKKKDSSSSEEAVSLQALLALIDLKNEKSCTLDEARIKNAEPPPEGKDPLVKDYKTRQTAVVALKILNSVCNQK